VKKRILRRSEEEKHQVHVMIQIAMLYLLNNAESLNGGILKAMPFFGLCLGINVVNTPQKQRLSVTSIGDI